MSSSTPSGSSGSHGGRQGSADWRLNYQIVPPWYKRPTYRCGRAVIVDIWEHDGTNRAGTIIFIFDSYFGNLELLTVIFIFVTTLSDL
jgi:hypothetical protein